MPPAKKPAARAPRRASDGAAPTTPAVTRKQVEDATARFERSLEEASDALRALAQDLGKGAQLAYKDVAKALRALRRDAQKTNRTLLKDLEKLADAVTPGKAQPRKVTPSAARPSGTGPAAKRSTAAGRRSSRAPENKPAGPRRRA
jgi:uncharacterized membrane protein YccC